MKKTKTTKLPVIVNFILDKSGSMSSVKDSTISGFNEYIKTLQKDKKNKYLLTLTLFNETTLKNPVSLDIAKFRPLNDEKYSPDGMTALYDAVCRSIEGLQEKKGQKVINIIMTDGEENSSKEYTQTDMRRMIENREKRGNWTFVYLGANQDSYANAEKFGIKRGNVANFHATTQGMKQSYSTMAMNTVMRASSGDTNSTASFFSKKDQDNLSSAK